MLQTPKTARVLGGGSGSTSIPFVWEGGPSSELAYAGSGISEWSPGGPFGSCWWWCCPLSGGSGTPFFLGFSSPSLGGDLCRGSGRLLITEITGVLDLSFEV